MSPGHLFITASGLDVKFINRLLLHLREWDSDGDNIWDFFQIINKPEDIDSEDCQETVPPVQDLPDNKFVGMSVAEIEGLMIAKDEDKAASREKDVFLVLDDQGVEDQTIIIAEQAFTVSSPPDATCIYQDAFKKVRVPWGEVPSIWINLEDANMWFQDFCVDKNRDCGDQGDYWFTYRVPTRSARAQTGAQTRAREIAELRDPALRELEDLGLA